MALLTDREVTGSDPGEAAGNKQVLSKPLIQQEEKCSSQKSVYHLREEPYRERERVRVALTGRLRLSWLPPPPPAGRADCRTGPSAAFPWRVSSRLVTPCWPCSCKHGRQWAGGSVVLVLLVKISSSVGPATTEDETEVNKRVVVVKRRNIYDSLLGYLAAGCRDIYNYIQNKAVRCPSNLFCWVSDGPMQTNFSWADGSSCYCLLWQVHSKTPGGNVTLISLRTKSVIRIWPSGFTTNCQYS